MALAIIAVLFSNVINLSWVIWTFSFISFIAFLNDDALLASTNAFIPFIIIPPIAATPWIIARVGIVLCSLYPHQMSLALALSYLFYLARVPVEYN